MEDLSLLLFKSSWVLGGKLVCSKEDVDTPVDDVKYGEGSREDDS